MVYNIIVVIRVVMFVLMMVMVVCLNLLWIVICNVEFLLSFLWICLKINILVLIDIFMVNISLVSLVSVIGCLIEMINVKIKIRLVSRVK